MGVAFAGFLVNLLAKRREIERLDDRVGMGTADAATLGVAEDGDSQRDWMAQGSPTRQ